MHSLLHSSCCCCATEERVTIIGDCDREVEGWHGGGAGLELSGGGEINTHMTTQESEEEKLHLACLVYFAWL